MAEKIDPKSTMFFNNDRPKYKNSVIELLKVKMQENQLFNLEILFRQNEKDISNEY